MREKLLTLIIGVTFCMESTTFATNSELLEETRTTISKPKVSANCMAVDFVSKILSENEVNAATYSDALKAFMKLELISTHNQESRMVTLSFTFENGETKMMRYQYPRGDQKLPGYLKSQFKDFFTSIKFREHF